MAPVMSPSWPRRPSLILDSTSALNAAFSKNGRVSGVSRNVGPSELTRMLCGASSMRHGLGEALHGVLGRAVDRAPRGADVAHLRGDVDDGARLLGLDQPAGDGLGDEVGRAHVEPHDGVEVVDGDVEQRLGPVGAGVVDEDVEGLGAGYCRLHGGEVGDVEDERLGLLPARADRCSGRLDLARACGQRASRARPASASAPAAASPMPRPAPVTSARLPSRRKEGAVASSADMQPACRRLAGPRAAAPPMQR